MEYKYYRDLKHSYVVCRCEDDNNNEKKDAKYQLKIMESGKIMGLLASSLRTINGEKYLYYEISSMMSIKDRYSAGGIGYDAILGLFSDIKRMTDSLAEYLLGEEGIVLGTDSIFVNMSDGSCGFMYNPFYIKEQNALNDFLEGLLDMADHDDERAVELLYGLCDMAQQTSASIIDITNEALKGADSMAKEAGKRSAAIDCSNTADVMGEDRAHYHAGSEYYNDYEESPDFDKDYDNAVVNATSSEETGMERAKRRLGGKVQLGFSLMFAAVVAGIMYIRMNYILTYEENLLSIAVMLVSGITGAVAFYGGLKQMKAPAKKEEPKPLDMPEYGSDDDYDDYDEPENYFKTPIHVTASLKKAESAAIQEYEETTVLDEIEDREMTLYSRNLDKTMRICLDKLPITIGKMEGCVDRVISDKSISRIHCRILRDDLGVAIVDLGSTNGSYRNGLRLSPQEKTYIEEGDELRLGRICFDLR